MIALWYLVCVVNAHLRVQRSGRLQDKLPGSISMGGQTGIEHAKQKNGNRQDSSIRPLIAEMGAGRSALSSATSLERVLHGRKEDNEPENESAADAKEVRHGHVCNASEAERMESVAIGWDKGTRKGRTANCVLAFLHAVSVTEDSGTAL